MDKNKKDLPIIEFDGKQVKPNKQGVYKCPFKCGNPGYSEPTWKTEKGFRQHMIKCHKRPSTPVRAATGRYHSPSGSNGHHG